MTVKLSPRATVAKGALMLYLAPRMAQDAAVDLHTPLKGVTAKNFKGKARAIAADIQKALKGKLAQDADVDDLADVLEELGEMLEQEDNGGGGEENQMPPNKKMEEDADPNLFGGTHEGSDDMPAIVAKVKEFLNGKISPEDMNELDRIVSEGSPAGEDEDPDENQEDDDDEDDMKKKPDFGAADEPPPFKGRPNPGGTMDKKAMDSQIAKAVANATQNQKDIATAEKFVRPWVGDFAMDSAEAPEDVYGQALKMLGTDIKGVHPSAFKILLEKTPKPGARQSNNGSRFAQDSAMPKVAPVQERFKNAARIVRM